MGVAMHSRGDEVEEEGLPALRAPAAVKTGLVRQPSAREGRVGVSTNRLSLAQHAYQTALRAARAESTPRTWVRLLRAANNLREASRDVLAAARKSRTHTHE